MLYKGLFNPAYGNSNYGGPFQNFTLTIPADALLGQSQLTVAAFIAIGVGTSSSQSYVSDLYDRQL